MSQPDETGPWFSRSQLGLADLLEAAIDREQAIESPERAAAERRLAALRSALGWPEPRAEQRVREVEERDVDALDLPDPVPHSVPPPTQAPRTPSKLAPVPFWRVRRWERRDTEARQPEELEPLTAAELEPQGDLPESPELMAWPRLHQRLHRLLASSRSGRRADLGYLVERVARRLPVARVPRRKVRRFPGSLWLVVDRSTRLVPLWQDQNRLVARLRKILGARLTVWTTLGVPSADGVLECASRAGRPMPEPGSPLLLLGDGGHYSGPGLEAGWRSFLSAQQARGHRVLSLLPIPASRPVHSLPPGGRRQVWDRFGRATPEVGWPRSEARDRLLELLSGLLYVEPGLLRALRFPLPAGVADIGTELDVWGCFRDQHVGAGTLDPQARSLLQERLSARGGGAGVEQRILQSLESLLPSWRRDNAPLLAVEERCTYRGLLGDARAEQIWGEARLDEDLGILARVEGNLARRDQGMDERLLEWAERACRRASAPVRAHKQLGSVLDQLQLASAGGRRPAEVGDYALVWDGDGIGLAESAGPGEVEIRRIRGSRPAVLVSTEGEWHAGSPVQTLKVGDRVTRVGPSVTCATDEEVLELDLFEKPMGADELSSGEHGPALWLGRVGGEGFISWDIAGPDPGASSTGRWVCDDDQPGWARELGVDEYGVYAIEDLGGVESRMRWIPGGRFVMGSPEDEEGRGGNEVQHEVEVQGFWLGETPVTQAQWSAVMPDNPSEFRHPDRPVDSVRWNDVQEFLRQRGGDRDIGWLRLPTEAEWEFACRAGTTSATFSGDLQILGERNAPVLDAIAWYGGNSGVGWDLGESGYEADWDEKQFEFARTGSRIVGRKRPNGLGLHDMLGNVLEWCSDWFGDYPADFALDPQGPGDGRSRVLRGGSWGAHARVVRAALRSGSDPGYRDVNVGFRLARGPALQEAEPSIQGERPRGPADEGSGTRPREAGQRGRGWLSWLRGK